MTDTIEPMVAQLDQQQIRSAPGRPGSRRRVALVAPGGLLTGLTKTALETALEVEMSGHLGYDKHESVGRNRKNSRNGIRSKTA